MDGHITTQTACPPKELLSEAVKQLRNLISVLVTTSLLWLVTAEAVRESLQTRERAKHLAAWLLVRDLFQPYVSEIRAQSGTERIKCFDREIPIQSGSEALKCEAFVMVSPWHAEARISVELLPIAYVKGALAIASDETTLPVSHYAVAGISTRVDVLPMKYVRRQRDLSNAVLRDGLAAPEYWPTTRTLLHARGWKGSASKELELNDPTVASFIKDGFSASYSVSGIPFAPSVYPAAVAVLIGLFGFLLIGPLLVIRRATSPPEGDPWVFLVSIQGRRGKLLSAAQLFASAAVAALPLLVMGTQFSLLNYLSFWECALWIISSALLLFTAMVLSMCVRSLWRWRGVIEAPANSVIND